MLGHVHRDHLPWVRKAAAVVVHLPTPMLRLEGRRGREAPDAPAIDRLLANQAPPEPGAPARPSGIRSELEASKGQHR